MISRKDIINKYMHIIEEGLSNGIDLQVVVVRHCFMPDVYTAVTKPAIVIFRVVGQVAE